jgi:hypothetical protein
MTGELKKDRFGNVHAPGLPYARGQLIADTQDDIQKLRVAWALIRKRVSEQGHDAVFNLSGLERGFRNNADERGLLDDELAAALHIERLTELGLEHLGGVPDRHDIMLLNRQSRATVIRRSPARPPRPARTSSTQPGSSRSSRLWVAMPMFL